jgi:hypothetical protein
MSEKEQKPDSLNSNHHTQQAGQLPSPQTPNPKIIKSYI